LRGEYAELSAKKQRAWVQRKSAKSELETLRMAQKNLNDFLGVQGEKSRSRNREH